MGKISMKGVCDMHVHTNPDLRLRAYDDFELADAAIRVGARAIVIKTHLGFTVNRAYLTNQYVKKVYGENTGFTMYGGVVMNKVIGGINPEAVEKGLKLGAKFNICLDISIPKTSFEPKALQYMSFSP